MRYRKLRQIILIMCCFYFIRSKVKKNGCVKKILQEQGVQDVVMFLLVKSIYFCLLKYPMFSKCSNYYPNVNEIQYTL